MKALCVRQPYAELIARGRKSIEVRTWTTDYRGPILIVASSSAWREDMPKFGLTDADCPRSRVVCIATLEDVIAVDKLRGKLRADAEHAACCELQRGDLLWCLGNVHRVAPIAVKGKLRLFDVPDATILPYVECPECGAEKMRAQRHGSAIEQCDACHAVR